MSPGARHADDCPNLLFDPSSLSRLFCDSFRAVLKLPVLEKASRDGIHTQPLSHYVQYCLLPRLTATFERIRTQALCQYSRNNPNTSCVDFKCCIPSYICILLVYSLDYRSSGCHLMLYFNLYPVISGLYHGLSSLSFEAHSPTPNSDVSSSNSHLKYHTRRCSDSPIATSCLHLSIPELKPPGSTPELSAYVLRLTLRAHTAKNSGSALTFTSNSELMSRSALMPRRTQVPP
ncbi:hypothetical protein R3P38DRAFT_3226206 [Favolaschia claudopus]|uniref:Uncharacterized protein n=1 Tax=Favolaschia claudopus TaxID=2862362 RepID=A0AAV9ZV42_9AGAR